MKDIHYLNLYRVELTHWWYRVRRKIVLDIFSKEIKERKLKILDVGCGTGALMKELRPYGEVYGLDFSERAIEFCKERGETNLTLGSLDKLPFPDNYFDIVLSLDVLEHIEDDVRAISEIKRVLRTGGFSIVFVPAFMFLWGKTDELSNHFRRYTIGELREKINSSGLFIKKSSYFNTFLFCPIFLTRYFIKIFRIKITNENDLGSGVINRIFYYIFYMESVLLRYFKFPFGVSIMVFSRKI